jgi:hypothetical protein
MIKQLLGLSIVFPLCLLIWDIETLKDVWDEVRQKEKGK